MHDAPPTALPAAAPGAPGPRPEATPSDDAGPGRGDRRRASSSGSGAGIAVAGPAVVVSYLIAGVLAMLVMRMLGEMSAAMPASGSFSVHAERALGRWAGFSVGWLYWFLLVVVLAVEATAAAQIANAWVPAVDQWLWVLMFMVVFTVANLTAVKNFGEFEFWFAALKVAAIVAFLVLGLLAVFGMLPDTDPVGAGQPHRPGRLPAERLGRRGLRCADGGVRLRRPGGRDHRGGRDRRSGARGGPCGAQRGGGASSSSTSARCWSS